MTLANGDRPAQNFETKHEAAEWIRDQLANKNTKDAAELGGPTAATLAQALHLYAHRYSITKGGGDSELNRINHYLSGVGLPWLRRITDSEGKVSLEAYQLSAQPSGWQAHNDARRAKRAKTYALIEELGRTRCSQVTTAKMRDLMTTMKTDGLSDSTIQKEVALLKHMFNMARIEWAWKGFENPCQTLKLGKSNIRFVHLTAAQQEALWKAVGECDNPYFWPLVVAAMETAQRPDRLLNMTWETTDLQGRVMHGWTKGTMTTTHLTRHLVSVLSDMPRSPDGRVFPLSENALKMCWNGVREKAGLPKLQFKDLRHLAATELARRGWNAHQLMVQLGHSTTRMSTTHVNLAGVDMLELMDRTAKVVPVVQVPPPANASAGEIQAARRSERLIRAAKKKWEEEAASASDPQDTPRPQSRNEGRELADLAQGTARPAVTAAEPSEPEASATASTPPSTPMEALAKALQAPGATVKPGATVIAVDFRRRAA